MKRKSDHCGGCGRKFTGLSYWPVWTRQLVDEGFCWVFVCEHCADRRDENAEATP